jgi:hypothetical protein
MIVSPSLTAHPDQGKPQYSALESPWGEFPLLLALRKTGAI